MNSILSKTILLLNLFFDSLAYRLNYSRATRHIFNIRAYLNSQNIKADLEHDGTIRLKDSSCNKIHYFNSFQRLMYFNHGIKSRSLELAESYGITEIKFFNDDYIIDIGANCGDLKLYFDLYLPNLHLNYIALDPGKSEYKCLIKNSGNYPSNIFNYAIGAFDTVATFYYAPESANSSLTMPPDFKTQYQVNVITLDSFVQKYIPNKKIKLLKIETEGAEFEVVSGATNILQRCLYISADLGFEKGISQESTAPEVLNFLIPQNFAILRVTDKNSLRFLLKNSSLDYA